MVLLPNIALRWIPEEKIRDYALDLNHREGGSKAKFFIGECGFTRAGWKVLSDAAYAQPLVGNTKLTNVDGYGQRYEVTGPITAPNGRTYIIRTDWIIRYDDPRPQLTSIKPGKK